MVQWNEVPEIDQNGLIVEYELLLEPTITFNGVLQQNTSFLVDFPNSTILLIELEENVEYSVRVRASTEEGFSPYSGRSFTVTREDGETINPSVYKGFR